MSVDLSVQAEPTVSVITTVPVSANGGEMDALLLGRIGVSNSYYYLSFSIALSLSLSLLLFLSLLLIINITFCFVKQHTKNFSL